MESKSLNRILDKYHENKLAHAFLLETNDMEKCFSDIIGLIKRLNCPFEYNDECDNECNLCNLINNDNLPSLITIEPEGQFIKKGQILSMMNIFSTKPVFSKFNMYIIKDASKFNASSANTLLKFLEEPEDNILGFFITNNKENVISTVRSRCQVVNCFYDIDKSTLFDNEVLDNVKIYLNEIYNNPDDILYNKTHAILLYKDRKEYEFFFNTMLYYLKDCLEEDRKDKIEIVKNVSSSNIVKMILEIENVLKYLKSNGNIELILDKFVIEMRKYYE